MSLPPLPVPAFDFANDAYTEEQMQAYGQQCFHLGMAQAVKKDEINEKD